MQIQTTSTATVYGKDFSSCENRRVRGLTAFSDPEEDAVLRLSLMSTKKTIAVSLFPPFPSTNPQEDKRSIQEWKEEEKYTKFS